MQSRGNNRDKIFPTGKKSVDKAKQLDKANSGSLPLCVRAVFLLRMPQAALTSFCVIDAGHTGDEPSLIMRQKNFEWPAALGFLNTLKNEYPEAYKFFQLSWFFMVVLIACWPY